MKTEEAMKTEVPIKTDDSFLKMQVNKELREIHSLRRQNRINEHQVKVGKLKEKFTYRELSSITKIPLKTLHDWCSEPKEKKHKASVRAQMKKDEFVNFLMQDMITYSHPCKRYTGKKFLIHTLDEVYKRYLQQLEFHKNGVISHISMRAYRPKHIMLAGSTPVDQCLCDNCENCDLIMRALVAVGLKGIPSNRYSCLEHSFCDIRQRQFGTSYSFAQKDCITQNCNNCGTFKLCTLIEDTASNSELLRLNQTFTWHQWKKPEGKSAPQKTEVRGTLRSAVNYFLEMTEDLAGHLFRANWNKNVFQYIKGHLQRGYILQVMDFAMNFNNRCQDEVQSAYWTGTQTTIHGTMNFFKCLNQGCNEIITLALVHISVDMKHNSFLACAVMNMTF